MKDYSNQSVETAQDKKNTPYWFSLMGKNDRRHHLFPPEAPVVRILILHQTPFGVVNHLYGA